MDVKVIIDYKVVLAIGAVAVGVIFAMRMDPAAIKEVSILAIGASNGVGNCRYLQLLTAQRVRTHNLRIVCPFSIYRSKMHNLFATEVNAATSPLVNCSTCCYNYYDYFVILHNSR